MVTPADPPAIHGLVLLGTDTVYAVHMPTFTSPYDIQAVLRVSLSTDGYLTARSRFGTSAVFTVRPQTYVPFEDLEPGVAFPAELYFGRFGRGGEPLGTLTVEVEETLYEGRVGTSEAEPLPPGLLRYVLFGREQLFLAHGITGPPDFDQVLTAQIIGEFLMEGDGKAHPVTVPGRPDDLGGRLRPGEQIRPGDVELRVLAEVYLETDDLA